MNVLELFAKLSLDKSEYEKGLDDAEHSASSVGSKLMGAVGTIAKVGAVAVGTAATALGAMGKQAVDAYSQYEQLVGGVETLFGAQGMTLYEYANSVGKNAQQVKDEYNGLIKAQETALANADEAYKTAGMSANTYMNTITSFAASLKQSTDSELDAVNVADMAIQDMSDNANKMGTSMESIQNAYQGFAKQNYTMLDNLKLGYGGTKTEMERLLEDAEKLSGQKYDISSLSDVYNAIHVIQGELGVTGTTAKEAMFTIEGSANMTKAAWENVVIAIGKGEGLNEAIDNLATSIFGDDNGGGLLNNIIPRIQTVMEGIGGLIGKAAPYITEQLPVLINTVVPPLIESGGQMIAALAEGLLNTIPELIPIAINLVETLVDGIADGIPKFIESAVEIIGVLIDGLMEAAPALLEGAATLIQNLVTGLVEAFPTIVEKVAELLTGIGEYLSENLPTIIENLLEMVQTIATTLAENAPILIEAAIELFMGLATGLAEALPTIIEQLPTIISTLANIINDNAPTILKAGFELLVTLGKGIIEAIPTLIENIPQIIQAIIDVWEAFNWLNLGKSIITGIKNGATALFGSLKSLGGDLVTTLKEAIVHLPETLANLGRGGIRGMINGIRNILPTLRQAAVNIGRVILQALSNLPQQLVSVGKNIVTGLWNGIADMTGWLINKIKSFCDSALGAIKDFFGIHSPSRVMADEVGKFLAMGVGVGMEDNADYVGASAENMLEEIQKAADNNEITIKNGLYGDITTGVITGGGGISELVNSVNNMLLYLQEQLPQVANTSVVLDTGVMVGAMAKGMDAELGKLSSRRARLV